MDEKILAYRKKHKRCRYCKYCKIHYDRFTFIIDSCTCQLKDREILGYGGYFCKWYEPKEG